MNLLMQESFLEFYGRHRISPVRRDLSDLEALFKMREGLFRQLGILPQLVREKRVMEVGPGSGCHSLYTASLGPSDLTLVEANPTGIAHIHQLFADYPQFQRPLRVVPMRIEDYDTSDRFDLVLCEGMLFGLPDPVFTLKHLARFVAPGGLLVITCVDAVSYFSETLRRLFAEMVVVPHAPLAENVSRLLPIFSPHLATLEGMNRSHEDWIIDNLINPAATAGFFPIPTAVSGLQESFDVYSASPLFFHDWRWYKTLGSGGQGTNEMVVEQYWQTVHNFLDYRVVHLPRSATANRDLVQLAEGIQGKIRDYGRMPEILWDIRRLLGGLIAHVKSFSNEAALALMEVEGLLEREPLSPSLLATCRHFAPLFGRGQQHLSLTRRGA